MDFASLTPDTITGIITVATSAVTGLGTFLMTRRSERISRQKEIDQRLVEEKKIANEQIIEEKKISEARAITEKVAADSKEAQQAEQAATDFDKLIQANQKFRDEIRSELDEARGEIEELKKKLCLKDKEIEELKNSIADLKQELSLKDKRLADMKIEIMRRNIKVEDLRGRVDMIDQRDAERQLSQSSTDQPEKPTP
jgi:chromosome segregation ATPase